MAEPDKIELEGMLEKFRRKVATEQLRVTQHAQQEMVNEEISLDEVMEAIFSGKIL